MAHEAGHRRITRFFEFVPPATFSQLGLGSLLTTVEERPTDQVVREVFPGAGEWVNDMRAVLLTEVDQARAERGDGFRTDPKFSQFENLLLYERVLSDEQIERYFEPDVITAYQKVKSVVKKIESDLPAKDDGEKKIVESAKRRYKLTYKELWPAVKYLVEIDKQEQTHAEFLKEIIREHAAILKGEKMGVKQDLWEEFMQTLSTETHQEIIEKILEGISPSRDGKPEPLPPEASPLILDEHVYLLDHMTKATALNVARSLSPDAQKAIDEFLNKLKEFNQQIQQMVMKFLMIIEDQLIIAHAPQMMDIKFPLHFPTVPSTPPKPPEPKVPDPKKTRQEEEQNKKGEIQVRESLAALAQQKTEYDLAYAEVEPLTDELYERLKQIFEPNTKKRTKLRSTGSHINLPAVFRWKSARAVGIKTSQKIFESVTRPEKHEYAVTLLVDLSGSMEDKIHETFRGVILLAEVLNRLGIVVEILGFQDEVIVFKEFDEPFTDTVRQRMSGMIGEVFGTNPGGHNINNYNDDPVCVKYASDRLSTRKEREKFLVVMSDGQPAPPREDRYRGSEDEEYGYYDYYEDHLENAKKALQDVVQNILKVGDQRMIGLGLGPDTEHVKQFYPFSWPNIRVKDLVNVLGDLLEDMLRNPQNYTFNQQEIK